MRGELCPVQTNAGGLLPRSTLRRDVRRAGRSFHSRLPRRRQYPALPRESGSRIVRSARNLRLLPDVF